MAVAEHRSFAPAESSVRVAVISVSDSRTLETDEGGALVQTLTTRAGFSVAARELVRDEPDAIRARVLALVAPGSGIDVVLLTGGTGVAPRDRTVDAITPLLERRLDGFGELFRMLSFAEIGPAAILTRAIAGIASGVAVFLMPGSPAGVRLAMERLILPELAHLVGQLRRTPVQAPVEMTAGVPDPTDSSPPQHHHHQHHQQGHDDNERH